MVMAIQGEGPMIWMDTLDIPLIYFLGGTFFESHPDFIEKPSVPDDYSLKRYKGGMVRPIDDRHAKLAPLGSFKWSKTQDALDGLSEFEPNEFDGYAVEFFNPSSGEAAHPNISSWMQKLPSGFHSKAHRHTSSKVYQVYKGSGYSVINGVKFEWSQGDYFVVPNWAWHEHVVTSAEDAYLFSVHDIPVMEKFGLQREEAL